ncbi:MAG: hypothetical protein H6835_17110 [Planctomycetes bacterium]|nr:hypothetical protein [Planctomycetota bacterium]
MWKILAALLSVMTVSLSAQDPQQQLDTMLLPEIERRLASDVAADVAWGGYLVHHYRLRRAQRQVCEALTRWRESDGRDARIVRLHLLDGLLGSGALVPADDVEFLLGDPMTREGAFCLIAQQPHSSSETLRRLAMQPAPAGDMTRMGAARVLFAASVRMDELTKMLVSGFVPEFVVDVDKPAEPLRRQLPLDWEPPEQPTTLVRIQGFPPLVSLRLENADETERFERVVARAAGDQAPLVLRRKEHAKDLTDRSTLDEPVDWTNHERRILLQMMTRVAVQERIHLRLRFHGDDAYLAEVVPLRDAQRNACDSLMAALLSGGYLSAEDLPGRRIRIDSQINDYRRVQAVGLPQLPLPSPQDR